MLIDHAEVTFSGGHGGAGLVSFGKMRKSGPDGGNGGDGGDVYVRAVSDLTLLNQFSAKQEFSGGNGFKGGQNKKTGKEGEDIEVLLPVGTSIVNKATGELIVELTEFNQKVLLCKGGKGGKGNWEFRSSRNTTPMFAQPGLPGDKLEVFIELKLIAEYGLIGLPNAGKSSLLNELTNANAKTGNYSFTTLSPNLGVFNGKIIADIPGLIEGASEGRGLGISFLKHIEKVKVLLHCISLDSQTPLEDYKTVRKELGNYNKALLLKKELLLLTKSDIVEPEIVAKVIKQFKNQNRIIIPISIYDLHSLEKLKSSLSLL